LVNPAACKAYAQLGTRSLDDRLAKERVGP